MPTTALTFATTEYFMKFGEQYTTGGLNLRNSVIQPRGIYRGFKLTTNVANRTITVAADPDTTDHVASYENAAGYSVFIRKPGGSFNIDLTTYAGKTVAIAIYATYAPNATTTAVIRVYEIDPSDEFTIATEFDELIVLGQVVVPAGASPIPADDITYDYRVEAWENTAAFNLTRTQLIKNPSFERAILNSTSTYAAFGWQLSSPTNTQCRITDTEASQGNNSFEINLTSAATISGDILKQMIAIPAFGGSRLKIKLDIKCLKAASAGTLDVTPIWRQSDGDFNSPQTLTVDISAIDVGFREVVLNFQADASDGNASLLDSLLFTLNGANYSVAGTGAALRMDNIQAWLEQKDSLNITNTADSQNAAINTEVLTFEAPGTLYGDSNASVLMKYSDSTRKLSLERLDQDSTSANQPILDLKGQVVLGSNLLTSDAKAILPRISTPYSVTGGVDYTLIWESLPDSGTDISSRLYINNNAGSLFFVSNASWNGTAWARDTIQSVTALELTAGGLYGFFKSGGVGTFASFDQTTFSILDGGSDTNVMTNALDFGFNFSQVLGATQPRIYFQAHAIGTEDRTELIESLAGDASNGHNRMYLTSTGNLEITKNCSWNGTAWERDFAANATKLLFDGSQFKLFIKLSADTGTPWNDSSWGTTRGYTLDLSNSTLTNIDGIYKITSVTTGSGGSNPPSTTAVTNELRAKNICKCWGNVDVVGGTPTVIDGFNITTTSISGGNLRVTMASAMSDTNYIAIGNVAGNPYLVQFVGAGSTTQFDLAVYDIAGTAFLDLATDDAHIVFTVWGAQG